MTNENDNPWIKNQDNWSNWHYDRIKSMLNAIDVGAIHGYADSWRSAGDSLGDLLGQFFAELNRTIQGRWSGPAADQAGAVLASYQALPDQIRGQFAAVGSQASSVANAVVQAKNHVNGITPPQQPNTVDTVLNGLTSGGLTRFGVPDAATAAAQQQTADQAARHAMHTWVTPAYNGADRNMPVFPPIKQPGDPSPTPVPPGPPPGPVGGGPVGGSGGGAGDPTFSGALPGPTTTPAAAGIPGPGTQPAATAGLNPTGSTSTSGFAGTPWGSGAGPGGVGDAAAGLGGAFGAPGGIGAAGGGSGPGSPGGVFAGRTGGFGAGAQAAEAAEAEAAEAAAAERGGAVPMAGPAGRGGKGSEDTEHRSPNYLQGPEDLFGYGPDGPRVISPVIGEE